MLSLWLRAAILVFLLLLALGGLSLLRPTRELFVVFAVDRSQSVGEPGNKAADDYVAKAAAHAGPNRFAVLPFAASRAASATDRGGQGSGESRDDGEAGLPQRPHSRPDPVRSRPTPRGSTARGPTWPPRSRWPRRRSRRSTSRGSSLLSDGNATAGDALKTAASMRGQGRGARPSPLPGRTEPEVQLSSVDRPGAGLAGRAVQRRGRDRQQPRRRQGSVEVYRGDIKVADQPVKLKKGENRIVAQADDRAGRLTPVTARLKGYQDTLLDNNSDFGLVSAAGKPRVLLVESDPEQAKHLTWALEEQNMQVDVRPPRGAPENLAELQNYDLLDALERAGHGA